MKDVSELRLRALDLLDYADRTQSTAAIGKAAVYAVLYVGEMLTVVVDAVDRCGEGRKSR